MLTARKRTRVSVALLAIMTSVVALVHGGGVPPGAGPADQALLVGNDPSDIAIVPALHRIFVLNYGDATVSMIDTHTKRIVRTLAIGGTPYGDGFGIVVAQRVAHVFVVDGDHIVRMLDARSGRVLRRTILPGQPTILAVSDQTQRVFVSESNNFTGRTISVLDARTGALLRRVTAGRGVGSLAVDERSGHVFAQNVAENTVSMLDARSGLLLRTISLGAGPSLLAQSRTLGGPLPAAVVIDPWTRRAFVTGYGVLWTLDTRTGTLLRTVRVGLVPVDVTVDVRANHVFVANLAPGTVNMLDARTGRLLRTVRVGGRPWAIADAAAAGRVCVADSYRTVRVLDARSGNVLRIVSVGLTPSAMAVDEQTARVYVVNKQAYPADLGPGRVSPLQEQLLRFFQWLPFGPHEDQSGTSSIPGSVSIVSVAH